MVGCRAWSDAGVFGLCEYAVILEHADGTGILVVRGKL